MAESFTDFVNNSVGKVINNGQCWGLADQYLIDVLGGTSLSTQGGTHPGYAIGSYTGFENNGLSQYFTKQTANGAAVPGSLAFWGWGTNYPDFQAPDSHVAIVLADQGNSLKVLSQNSGSNTSQIQVMPKEGLAGYLVPNGSPPASAGTDNSVNTASTAQNANWLTDSVLGGLVTALGWGGLIQPNSPFAQAGANAITGVLLPSTWVRVLSFFIGMGLITGGIIFIIMDYKKTGESNGI